MSLLWVSHIRHITGLTMCCFSCRQQLTQLCGACSSSCGDSHCTHLSRLCARCLAECSGCSWCCRSGCFTVSCAYVRHPNQALHAGQYALYHMLCPAQHCAALHTSSHGLQGLYGVGAAGAVGLALTQVAISFPFLFSRN